MGIILALLYYVIFVVLLFISPLYKEEGMRLITMPFAFTLKLMAGIGLTIVYLYYYNRPGEADILKYYDDSKFLFDALKDNPLDFLRMVTGIDGDAAHLQKYYDASNYWFREINYNMYNDNRTIIRLNAVIRIFSQGHIGVHVVFFAFMAFTGLAAIYKAFFRIFELRPTLLAAAIFLVPSTLFWTSGMLKESVLMLPLGFFILSLVRLAANEKPVKNLIILLISFYFLMIIKFYILLCIIPGAISFFWLYKTNSRHALIKVLAVHLVFFVFAYTSDYIFGHSFVKIMSWKQHDFVRESLATGNVGSLITIPELQPTWLSILKNSPGALFNVLFRPTVFEAYSPFVLMAAIENLLIIILAIACFFFYSKSIFSEEKLPFAVLSISIVLCSFILIGLITPVLGAIVRYKSPVLPFMFLLFMMYSDRQKFRDFLFKIKVLKKPVDYE